MNRTLTSDLATWVSPWYEGCSFSNVCRSVEPGSIGPIYLRHSHSFKVLSSASHTHSSSRLRQNSKAFWKPDGDNASLNSLLLWGLEFWMREHFRPANFSLMRVDNQKWYEAKLGRGKGGEGGHNLDVLLRKVTVTLALWALLRFGIHFCQAQLITSHISSRQTTTRLMRSKQFLHGNRVNLLLHMSIYFWRGYRSRKWNVAGRQQFISQALGQT